MLTPYDEYPVHQSPYTFAYIPSTDYNWDDGYYFGAMSPAAKTLLCAGVRVNPNSDLIGGYAILNVNGIQTTFRFNRCWRRNFNLEVGPFHIEFLEPLRKIKVTLGENESGLSFDMIWEGTHPPVVEKHHLAESRCRRMTDQTRYSQAGKVSGWFNFRGNRTEMNPDEWLGARDHSWGLYAERPPLAPSPSLLPSRESSGPKRGFRFWTCFRTGEFSGHYEINESSDGKQIPLDDVFGVPFSGTLYRGWDEAYPLTAGRHELEYHPGTRLLKQGSLFLTDAQGREWKQEFEAVAPPWVPDTMGYHPGSWKDGGTFHTYHGSEELATEWDEFDFSEQPFVKPSYLVKKNESKADTVGFNNFGLNKDPEALVYGREYILRAKTYAPDGSVSVGAAHLEHVITPPYTPYGFK